MTSPVISYTDRNYQSVRRSLIDRIKARFPNDWPEFIDTDTGMAFLDIVSHAHEQRAYYYDVQALNCYLETATLPEAVILLSKQLGYERRLPTAASVSVTLYPTPPQNVAVTIREEEVIIAEGIRFEAAETYVIPAGKPSWPDATTADTIIFVEGETKAEEFVSNGESNQSFTLSFAGTIQGSVEITVDAVAWEETESLIVIEGTGQGHDTFIGTGEDDQFYQLSLLHTLIDPEDEDVLVVTVNGEKWLLVEEFTGAPQEFRAVQNPDGETTIYFDKATTATAPPR